MAKNSRHKKKIKQISTFLNPKKCKIMGKTQYAIEKDANAGMMRMWSHDPAADLRDLHTYKCEHCGGWHIGHISKYMNRRNVDTVSVGASQ